MSQGNGYPGCEICELLPRLPAELKLIENEYWDVNLGSQDQALLGRSYITLKRHASELDELTDTEEAAFIQIRNQLFQAMRTVFHPITFNMSCLKNDAFQSDPDHTPSAAAHVHWHLVPRYGAQTVVFAGEQFVDPCPGRYLEKHEPKRVPAAVALRIADAIRAEL